MKLKHITFTGIDAKTDLDALKEIQKKYRFAEFGVLTSYHWYENGNRYLDPQIIDSLRSYDLKLALHVCGKAASDAAIGHWHRINKLVWTNLDIFKRIQLNVSGRKDCTNVCHVPMYNSQEVIIQEKDVENVKRYTDTINYYEHSFIQDEFSMLLDGSGGRGVDTGLTIYPSDRKIGYAGGFNPDNVGDKLSYLLENVKTGTFWIDMESGVRTDDWFDLDKVTKVLETCELVIKDYYNTTS